jgi:uncharacterized protein
MVRFKFIGKSLYFPEEKLLAIADLHIGYEESLNKQGIFVPRVQFKQIMQDLEEIFGKIDKTKKKVDKIVIVGDLKHEFGEISSQEWREVKEVLDFLKGKAERVVLVKGNHDTILRPIAGRKELEVKDYFIYEGICFLHGNKIFPECLNKKVKIIVLGHRHPAVVLADDYKKEKYKCFLVGKWKGKQAIILPSFLPFVEGSDIVNIGENRMLIPEKNLKDFEVYAVGDNAGEAYGFGKLKDLV